MGTRTGNFPIGFRRGCSDWQKKDLKALAHWARSSGFDRIDLGTATTDDIKTLRAASLDIGSADLLDFDTIMHSDESKRKECIAKNLAYVKEAAAAGAKVFFTAIIPGDPAKKRAENYKLALESYAPIARAAD